jgi:hypothetical protein
MSEILLRERVYSLAARLSGLGIGADLLALSYFELEALYRFLVRVECGG